MSEELKPCPFCGAGETRISEARQWTGMAYSEPISVSVRHWCTPVEGQPSRMIERIGRDHASAVAAWNRRTVSGQDAQPVALWAAFATEGNLLAHSELRPGLTDILNWEPLYRAAPIPATELSDVLRALLIDLVDDVQDYADSRQFKEVEAKWRADLLKRGRAILAARPLTPE